MEFKPFHKEYFKALNGAYSIVTEREYYDSQITLTDIEAEIVIRFFGVQNIHIGNVVGNPIQSSKEIFLYPSLTPIKLNLVFPKPHKTELRLYLSIKAGYKPIGGDIWFIFENQSHKLVIGSMDESIWNNLGQVDVLDEEYIDSIEDKLSSKVEDKVPPEGKIVTTVTGSRIIYQRDPQIAIFRLKASNYSCEINSSHSTFISQKTGLRYMEAHHLIPIKFQPLFTTPLDNFNNIISLCPNCHRGIHHAVVEHKYEMIQTLYNKRPEMNQYTFDYIAQFYNCLKIISS